MAMDRLFHVMRERGVSDMFLTINSAIYLKIKESLIPIDQQKIDKSTIQTLLEEVVPDSKLLQLTRDNELNMGLSTSGVGSFWLSVSKQRGSISAFIRYVSFETPPSI